MDIREFKAWFEGFCDSIDGTPSPEQWAKIKAKVQGIEASKVTYRQVYPNISPGAVPRWGLDNDDRTQPMVAR